MMPPVRSDVIKSAMILREARLRAGLSQIALAERSGKDRVQIGRYESGAVAPSVDTLSDLIRACGFELVLELAPPSDASADVLPELQQLSPERRVDRLLDQLGENSGR
jgi:transcriptional regulator with XRE-family HTH domain